MFSIPWTTGGIRFGLRIFLYFCGTFTLTLPCMSVAVGSSTHSTALRALNAALVRKTEQLLAASGRTQAGSCNFNLTLINKCFPETAAQLKQEPLFKQQKATVSWHADSTLEHFSSIAVYHSTDVGARSGNDRCRDCASLLPPAKEGQEHRSRCKACKDAKKALKAAGARADDGLWKVALRVQCDAEGPNTVTTFAA